MELIFSTSAGGKVVSMPKMIPIFFTMTPSSATLVPSSGSAIVCEKPGKRAIGTPNIVGESVRAG
jgi:hypothetical protein